MGPWFSYRMSDEETVPFGQTVEMVITGFYPFLEVRVGVCTLMMLLQIYGDGALNRGYL